MAKNENLHKAKEAKNDEFYTQYEDIQLEMNHYERHFAGKTVLCNCDDPFESNFCKFFLRNFNHLRLARLICTSYSTSPVIGRQLTLFDEFEEEVRGGNGYVMDITEVPMANGRGVSDDDIDRLLHSPKRGVKKLKGDGDFRSEECVDYLRQADIVVTNPPFSLFREYVAQFIEYDKKFLIIGNINAITYKEIFPLIKDNKLWLGCRGLNKDMYFNVKSEYQKYLLENKKEGSAYKIIDGVVMGRLASACWYTNLDHNKRHEELVLYKHYYGNEQDYPKYDNYDAINVDKTSDIPCDYFADMGVPITYLDKHNPEQFEIVKFRKGNDEKDLTYSIGADTILTEQNRTEQNRTEQNRTEQAQDYALLQNHHQAQGVTESWACQSLSLTNTIPTSSRLWETNTHLELNADADMSQEGVCIQGFSSGAKCNGVMGVPITFLDKYNPEQFEILGITLGNTVDYTMTTIYRNAVQHNKDGTTQGGGKVNTRAAIRVKEKPVNTVYYTADNADGYLLSIYPRILVKRRAQEWEQSAAQGK